MRSSPWPPRRSRARWSVRLAALPCALVGKTEGRMPVVRHARAVCSCTPRHAAHAAHSGGCSGCVCVRVRVSVLIDSEPRSCSHVVGQLDDLRVRLCAGRTRLSTSCRPSHRTFSGCSCSPRSASPTSESAPPVSPDIVVEVVHTCTRARMHAASCAACTQAPAALKPSRNCAKQIWNGVACFCRYTAAGLPASHTQHSTCNAQRTQLNLEGHRRSLPRRCCKLACRRVGCRCMCAAGNGQRVTNGLRG